MRQNESFHGEITPEAPLRSRAIYLFDSDSAHRKRVKRHLTERGHKVVSHRGLEEFGPQCTSHDCACILCETSCSVGSDGLSVLDDLSSRGWQTPVIFLANPCQLTQIVRLMNAGAFSVVSKTGSPDELLATVDQALAEAERSREKAAAARSLAARIQSLSGREIEVVKMASIGMQNQDIADHLGLALITVKTHRANAMRKMNAGNIVQLAQMVIMAGLIDPVITEGIVDARHDGQKAKPQAGLSSRKRAKRKNS